LLKVLRDEDLIAEAREVAIGLVSADPKLHNTPELAHSVEALMFDEISSFVEKG
jgi:ATP-dependent DNA helicase RecG